MRRTTFLAGVTFAALSLATFGAGRAQAVDLRYVCYQDGNECEVMRDLLTRFTQQNPNIHVNVDIVPYRAILESLPVQLATNQGPDLARVTDYGGLGRYFLDIAPYVDRAYWEASFADTLPWFRVDPADHGIYGMMTQLTVTGAFVNKTLFEQAHVPLPGATATWDEWAAAARRVAQATQTPFPMALDRSGHRFAAPAISYGARFFDASGAPHVVDDGFRTFAQKFVTWNQDGTMAREVWGGQGGTTYRDAAQEFINGRLVFYYSGSWQVSRFEQAIGDNFDWVVTGSPCGQAGCSAMPGGAGIVGFRSTREPEAVARVINFFAQAPVYRELMARTRNISAHRGLLGQTIDYPGASPAATAALQAFGRSVPQMSPVAYQWQAYTFNRAIGNATVTRLTQAIVGEQTIDAALGRIDRDVAEAVAAGQR
jgi:alpha-1,4-digalacturonate transport system substrate-binding protein